VGGSGRDEFLPGLLLSAWTVGPVARLPDPEPLEPTSITTLLPLLNPTQLLMKQEPLPPKMLLLSWTGMKHQLRTENVNTHAPQPEDPTNQS